MGQILLFLFTCQIFQKNIQNVAFFGASLSTKVYVICLVCFPHENISET